ncbi:hypothetical protein M407DRAFT_243825 [Tulasnella calospora MUT 4182]|uniref:Enhancer of mRNA-decapping protein 4 WD40 repeat region domain-containing protein n=1 Tax=Tulasnella calospora MUT 4182 TaxID=1051891 RepID=A0A0C3Q8G8_9AGAM|nr:hypothetical protein M407DRAFT_243825 [Tulasnella calospora MUT 4182]
MQHSDLLSLFQRPPQQPTDSGQPAAEKSSQPIATPEPPQPASAEGQGSKDIESLFRGLQSPTSAAQPPSNIPLAVASPDSIASASTANTSANTDKQQAILNLLGTVSSGRPAPPREAPPAPSVGPNTQPANTSQPGKQLLEQLVSGNPPSGPQAPQYSLAQQSQYTQSTNSTPSTTTTGMPASHSVPPPNTHGQHLASAMSGNHSDREAAADAQRKAIFDFISPYEALQSNQSQSQLYQPLNQPLNSPPTTVQGGPTLAKKKPVPAYNPSPQQVAGSTNASPQVSPKQSQLQRRHTPSPDPGQYAGYQQGNPSVGDIYTESLNVDNAVPPPPMPMPEPPQEPRSLPTPPGQAPGPQHGPLPPLPTQQQQQQQQSSPTSQRLAQQVQQPLASPPMRPSHPGPNNSTQRAPTPPGQRQVQELAQQQQLQGQRSRGSPASTRQPNPSNQPSSRDGASSPAGSGSSGKRGPKSVQQPAVQSYGSPGGRQNGRGPQYSPNQHALISVDVTSPLASTLAAPDIVSITPIALLKLEPTYTRGTTIGVANFIAYSMSRGRIRLIGRQTGERALLKLPATFPAHAQVQDMVISGTKLACVSTDGGLVVWDIPEDIEDDAASVSRIILHVPPPLDAPGFKVVKWHPKQSNLLAVASEQDIFLLNIEEAYQAFGSEGVSQDELGKVATVFSIPSPLVSITFDVPQIALASISVDSTITLWSIQDKLPFWSGRIHGEGVPSSIDFLEGGLVVGRNQGNIIQLLPVMSTTVLSTIKFSLGSNNGGNASKAAVENPELMFGHLCYDPASRILWVASSARNSLFAVKIGTDSTPIPSAQPSSIINGPVMNTAEPTTPTVRPTFDQVVEFPCSMPTINLTLVAAEAADENATWTRDPSLVVSAFCVHAGGVDQINIAQEAYDIAAANTAAKLPSISFGPLPTDRAERRTSGQNLSSAPQPLAQQAPPVQQQPVPQQQPPPQQAPVRPEFQQVPSGSYSTSSQQQAPVNMPSYGATQRSRTPPLDHGVAVPGFDPTISQQSPLAQPQIGGKGKSKDVKQTWKASPSGAIEPTSSRSDTEALASGVTKEIRKVEENLHNKISRLIVKELDKQHSRLEDIRLADQTADFERQEKILKLISTELTKNTTRVVESAVKNVIQNSVLPALETVTRSEVKAALNTQIAKGLADSMKQTLPIEIEKLLLRPDVSNHVARTFSAAITPTVERHVKETINMTLIPAYTQATDAMHQEISREIHAEILSLKKEIVTWQSDALKGTENLIRDMEQSIRSLSEQVRTLSTQVATSNARAGTPSRTKAPEATPIGDYQARQQVAPPPPQNTSSSFMSPYSQPPSAGWINSQMNVQQPLGPPPSHHPNNIQQAAPPLPQPQPARTEDWDDTFLTTLGLHDQQKLRELLQRCPPDVVMPTGGQPSPLSQTVILALIHRLALSLTEVSPADELFKASLWWLQRSAYALNPNDNVIAPYIGRVLQTAVSTLNTTGQRLNVLPGPGLQESSNMIAQIQQSLSSLMT